jgi:hypothetical protein
MIAVTEGKIDADDQRAYYNPASLIAAASAVEL